MHVFKHRFRDRTRLSRMRTENRLFEIFLSSQLKSVSFLYEQLNALTHESSHDGSKFDKQPCEFSRKSISRLWLLTITRDLEARGGDCP
jgi:hypothetical protein